LHGVDGGCGAVGYVLAAIDFRDSGYVNTAKTHRYHIRFVRDIFGALRRSIRYRFQSNLSWPQRTLPLFINSQIIGYSHIMFCCLNCPL
jgi:hypothetical protein